MTDKKDEKPAPSEDDVLRRMLSTAPKPHDTKPTATKTATKRPQKGKGKKNKKERERQTESSLDMGSPASLSRSPDGRLTSLGPTGEERLPLSQVLKHYYKREGKSKNPLKILSVTRLGPNKGIATNPNEAMLTFDAFIAFDTNTWTIRGERVSAACVLIENKPHRNGTKARMDCVYLEFANFDGPDPELFTLAEIIKYVQQFPHVPQQVAIVTDLDLAKHEPLQSRQMPVLGDLFLPEWATLIFATDSVTDHVINMFVKDADRLSKELLTLIEQGADLGPKVMGVEHVSHMRKFAQLPTKPA